MDDRHSGDVCRVCRCEGSTDKPLYYPCVCTGSIKYIHQDCLVQWLKYSKKENCELCKHRYTFMPIYAADMPKRLPIRDIVCGLLRSVARAVRYWLHYTLVAIAWLGLVPLTACRIYRCLFTGSISSILTLPLDMLSTENLLSDCLQGCFVVTCTLCTFISLVWLRDQILHGAIPDWLADNPPPDQPANDPPPADDANIVNVGVAAAEGGGGMGEAADPQNDPFEDQRANPDENVQEDRNNGLDWDRAADWEELTWERLLGLDGSLLFMEHVFWVVSLNTLFIMVFAFFPYHIGHLVISYLNVQPMFAVTKFEGILTGLVGYIIAALFLIILQMFVGVARLRKAKKIINLCYIIIKVTLLLMLELGIFPLICGWWLDVCSLSMFDSSLRDRANGYRSAPATSMFIHWIIGMVYIFYFASFVLLIREVLRPGLLWFLRNLNDQEFNPIQEMIQLPVYRHIRRFLASSVVFGSIVVIMLYLPIQFIHKVLPTFLPYHVLLSSPDTPVSELSLELLLLQVILPALLEQGHTRQWLKSLIRAWCVLVARLLDLRSYLLGDVPLAQDVEVEATNQPAGENNKEQPTEQLDPLNNKIEEEEEAQSFVNPSMTDESSTENAVVALDVLMEGNEDAIGNMNLERNEENAEGNNENIAAVVNNAAGVDNEEGRGDVIVGNIFPQGLGEAHHAMMLMIEPSAHQPYLKPNYFIAKIICLVGMMAFTLFIASILGFLVPVGIGRLLMSFWTGETKVHELYTAACGLYTCWITLRVTFVLYMWIPEGWHVLIKHISDWTVTVLKIIVVAAILFGLVPLMLGVLFELVLVVPLRVPLDQTPVFFLWQDWALGILHTKIITACILMGPPCRVKRIIEQVYNQGLRNLDMVFIMRELCCPVIVLFASLLVFPYVFTKSLLPLFDVSFDILNLVHRRIYPFILIVSLSIFFFSFQARQFRRLYEHIKNDKYLVGQRLVNYERRNN